MFKILKFDSKSKVGNATLIHLDLQSLDFATKRIYWIPNLRSGDVRAEHAHKRLTQIYICLQGRLMVTLDDGFTSTSICLDSPKIGLQTEDGIWRKIESLSDDTLLLVIADELYDENDYIRDYKLFRAWKEQQVKK